jgi:dihydroflavonol-4-reductase
MITAVTGASGHIGANLIRALLDENRKIRALVRNDTRALEGLNIEVIQGDILDKSSLEKLCDGAVTVYHAAAHISITSSDKEKVDATNIIGTRNVVQSCLNAGVKRLVHFSSIQAFYSPDNDVIDERCDLSTSECHFAYDRSKALSQIEISNGIKQGLDCVTVNPTAVIGPYDYKPSRIGGVIVDLYKSKLPITIKGCCDWVDSRDVAFGAIAAEKYGKCGECYILSGHLKSFKEFTSIIKSKSDYKGPVIALPGKISLIMAHIIEKGSLLLGIKPNFTPYAVEVVQCRNLFSHRKAAAHLGYDPRPFENTLNDTIMWFKDQGMIKTAN